jgi:hypothetical protein
VKTLLARVHEKTAGKKILLISFWQQLKIQLRKRDKYFSQKRVLKALTDKMSVML